MRRRLPGAAGISYLQAVVAGALAALSGPGFAQGDVETGRLKADTCMGCHGIPSYTNVYPTYHVPKLGGQHAEYIVAALQAYKTGQRDHDTMRAQASGLSTKDMEDIAAYFESLEPEMKAAPAAGGAGNASGGQQQAAAGGAASAAGAAAGGGAGGARTYAQVCSTCHDAGTAGAPMISDQGAWRPRVAQGKQTLYQHAIQGLGAMPPKGGDASLSDAEVRAAVDYMVAQVGGGKSAQEASAQASSQPKADPATKQTTAAPDIHATSTPEGASTFEIMCANCHVTGTLGAPMVSDKTAWQARLVKGKQALYSSALGGIGNMPARGGHPQLSDSKVKAAVDHMIATVTRGNGSTKAPAQAGGESAKAGGASQAPQPAKAKAKAKAPSAAPTIQATSTPEGESTYQIMCANCHNAGALGAPKITDKAAWLARLIKGKQALYSGALSGIGNMPAKGGHSRLSEQQVKAAVDHIIATVSKHGGGKHAKSKPQAQADQGEGESPKQSQSDQAKKGESK